MNDNFVVPLYSHIVHTSGKENTVTGTGIRCAPQPSGAATLQDPVVAPLKSLPLPAAEAPIFSFGVITDVQYADIADGQSFRGVPRYYRHSLQVLRRAVNHWNQKRLVNFAVQLGDIVDGFCPKEESLPAVMKVLSEFNSLQCGTVYHILGNHCLYNLPRNQLNKLLKFPSWPNAHSYYDFTPSPNFRFVILDGYDVSAIGWPEEHAHRKAAIELLKQKNPNSDKNSPDGLIGEECRFVKFNGGVGEDQLIWLNQVLKDAVACRQKVIVCCHIPLHPGATSPNALLWNYNEVLDVIHQHNCVIACLAGHDHTGGYVIDSHGIHHRVLEAVLECPPGTNAFGHIDVFHDKLSLIGNDRMASVDMAFDPSH
ncbi:hypothetical protein O6H91_03G031600 [Diphasiastrum complanatum]|nr:hypothetical protein O6H91_Y060300 [Diphasiastrum complanatum]KAJ7561527.1 hypothetical protein O6H91_03G031600 [Diphasiastrum complanatum]